MDFKPLITLPAIFNPLAIVPVFIHYTQGFSNAQKKHTIVTASFSAFLVIAVSALLGLKILEFFNISLASFQVGGGMLLLISAMEEGAEKATMGASIAVVPLTIPLLTGPATMSTVVIYAEKAQTWLQTGMLVGYGLATALCFSLADPISRVLGKTGINVMTHHLCINAPAASSLPVTHPLHRQRAARSPPPGCPAPALTRRKTSRPGFRCETACRPARVGPPAAS